MGTRLGKELQRARAKAKLSGPALARRAGVGRSWLTQVETGRILRPDPVRLAKVAAELGLEVRELLGLSDQLGAAYDPERATETAPDLIAALIRHTAAMEAQTAVMGELVGWLASLAGDAVAGGVEAALRVRAAGASPRKTPRRQPA